MSKWVMILLAIALLIFMFRAEYPGKTLRNLAIVGVVGLFLFYAYRILGKTGIVKAGGG